MAFLVSIFCKSSNYPLAALAYKVQDVLNYSGPRGLGQVVAGILCVTWSDQHMFDHISDRRRL